jgi:hypothetical protein
MNTFRVLLTVTCVAMLASGAVAQEASEAAALDKLMAVVGRQLDLAGKELKGFLTQVNEDLVDGAIDIGVEKMADKLEVTPEQRAEIEPILRRDIENTGKILDEALTVGMAAARASLSYSIAEQWGGLRDELEDVLNEEQLLKADAMHEALASELIDLFEPQTAETDVPPSDE